MEIRPERGHRDRRVRERRVEIQEEQEEREHRPHRNLRAHAERFEEREAGEDRAEQIRARRRAEAFRAYRGEGERGGRGERHAARERGPARAAAGKRCGDRKGPLLRHPRRAHGAEGFRPERARDRMRAQDRRAEPALPREIAIARRVRDRRRDEARREDRDREPRVPHGRPPFSKSVARSSRATSRHPVESPSNVASAESFDASTAIVPLAASSRSQPRATVATPTG